MFLSLPSRERGLKLWNTNLERKKLKVAPFAGAWIEIRETFSGGSVIYVAPFAGAWIEIVT